MHSIMKFVQRWRYLILLGALLALLVVQPIASEFGIMDSLFDVLVVVVMAALALALAQDKIWRVIACIACVPAATLLIGGQFLNSAARGASLTAGHAIGAIFFIAVAGMIVRSIFGAQETTWDSIFGAICGYLLLGVAGGMTYAMIHTASPASFQLGDAIKPHLEQVDYGQHIFIYYSFVTLTTVGYGDVVPLSISARTLSWVEAVTGQLYLAVLIAGLIGAMVAKSTALKTRQ